MDAQDRLREVLLLADGFQRRAHEFHEDHWRWPIRRADVPSDLLGQMQMAVAHYDAGRREQRSRGTCDPWCRAILEGQIEPVYRAIVAARTQQKAPSPATYGLILLWFRALLKVAAEQPEERGGWFSGVKEPLRGWTRQLAPPKSKKEAA